MTLDPSATPGWIATTKGFPTVDRPIPLADVAEQGWSLADLLPPVLVLRESALAHNVALMADYCATHGVELAPHGKTTMAPQLWRRQLDAGAWGITAATVGQARVMLAAGVRARADRQRGDRPARDRVDRGAAARPRRRRSSAPWIPLPGVELLAAGHASGVPRPLPVLVSSAIRAGAPDAARIDEALEVARLVTTKPQLALAGATGFEGTIGHDRTPGVPRARSRVPRPARGAHRPAARRRPGRDRRTRG